MSSHLIIAIDGPAGSGKSTLARALAARLELDVLDTGASYRALAAAALHAGLEPSNNDEIAVFAKAASLGFDNGAYVNEIDFSASLRSETVNAAVSLVAANPAVREVLVSRQREWAESHQGGVVEGRDIGTVVFPDADIKLFLTASSAERARRRSEEDPASVARRDEIDSTRSASPLSAAQDAWVIDTTSLAVDEIIEMVLQRLKEKGGT
jgi:cytidylate kinase